MQSVKIEEIADELGMKSKEIIKRFQMLYKDIKSPKSKVTPQIAQEIFDAVVHGITIKQSINPITYNFKNMNLYFSSNNIDISMLEKIATTYKEPTQKEFMIRSFNFSEHSIVKILVAGLINLDIKKYIELKSTNNELLYLLNNMKKVLYDVDYEGIDGKNPLDSFEQHIEMHQPEIVYIEGVNYANFVKYKQVFELIKKLVHRGTIFEIGFVNIESETEVNDITSKFRNMAQVKR